VLNLSHLVAELGGTSAQAGYAFTISSIGGIIYGLVFGQIYKRLGRRVISFSCATITLLFIICAFAQQLWILYLGMFMGGFTIYAIFVDLGITTTSTPDSRVKAIGINMATANVAIFLSGFFIHGLGGC